MEIKVYTLKLNPPRWLRNALVYVVLPVGVLLGGALTVRAGVTLTTFTANTPIKSADVNANFASLNTALTALQASSAQLYGVAGAVATISNGVEIFTAASCGPTGRVLSGFCVTTPVQPTGGATGLWRYGPYDALLNVAQTAADPALNSLWLCDVKAGNGVTVQAYALCMKAP